MLRAPAVTMPSRATHEATGAPSSLAPSSVSAMRPAAPARLSASKLCHTHQLPPVTIRPHFGSLSTEFRRTDSQRTSSSSATMRASAVPSCWPISALAMLTVTMPSRSIWNQMVGSNTGAAGAASAPAPANTMSARRKASAKPAPTALIMKPRRALEAGLGAASAGRTCLRMVGMAQASFMVAAASLMALRMRT